MTDSEDRPQAEERILERGECLNCSTPFLKQRHWQKFCKIRCRDEYHDAEAKQLRHQMKEDAPRPTTECETCGNKFEQLQPHQRFCKPKCRSQAYAKTVREAKEKLRAKPKAKKGKK